MSFTTTFNDAKAKEVKRTQYFEIMGSRGIYHDGWMASAFGPRVLWLPGLPPGIQEWMPGKDKWELYKLDEDWSQANDLAAKMPAELEDKKEAAACGCRLFIPSCARHHPTHLGRSRAPLKGCRNSPRQPSGNKDNLVSIDVDLPANPAA